MGRRGRSLAGRFRRAVEEESERLRREEEASRGARERGAKARSDLFRELAAFAEETGFLETRVRDGALTLVRGERCIHFRPVGEGHDIVVEWDALDPAETHRLYLEEQLGAWVWGRSRPMRHREDRELFWDKGLEELMVTGLGLPRPSDDEPDEEPSGESGGGRTL